MNHRYHGLDLARAVFMLLGVFYHVALIYEVGGEWRVTCDSNSIIFNYFTEFIHDFRMPAFYFMAGFFFVLVVEKYGIKKTLITRILRLAIPLIFIGFTLNYYTNLLSINEEYTYDLNYILEGRWLGHLWFIGNLIVYAIVSLFFIPACINKKRGAINTTYMNIFMFIPFLSLLLALIRKIFFPDYFIFISFHFLFLYFPYYFLGIYLYVYREHLFKLFQIKYSALLFVSYLALKILLRLFDFNKYIDLAISSVGSTFLVFAIIGFFTFIAKKSKKLDEYVGSSYTVYLLHEPFIVYLFPFVSMLNINPIISFLLLSFSVFYIGHFLHHKVIKNSKKLMFLFNGIVSKKVNSLPLYKKNIIPLISWG